MISVAQLMNKQQNGEEDLIKMLVKPRPKSLEEAVKELVNRDRNNDIVIEAMDMGGTEASPADGKASKAIVEKFENSPNPALKNTTAKHTTKTAGNGKTGSKDAKEGDTQRKVNVTTDYIIDGDTQLVLNVSK
jgi:hypothetical protein